MNLLPVSVVIPTFRDGEALRRALASVASQTRAAAEVFVVDDAGGDPAIKAIIGDFPSLPLTLIELEENVGPGGARNAGIKKARTSYVAFLDADDEWHPRKLEHQMAVMLGPGSPFLSAHIKSFRGHEWPEQTSAESSILTRWKILLSNPASISTVIVARDRIEFNFPQWYAGEDYAFVSANLLSGMTGVKLDLTLARAHKAPFGAGGLSGRTLAMQIGEMRTHRLLRGHRLLKFWELSILMPWTLLKYIRRVAIIAFDAINLRLRIRN
jgi:glycosyltransferase involved in cell wall biosynthesis